MFLMISQLYTILDYKDYLMMPPCSFMIREKQVCLPNEFNLPDLQVFAFLVSEPLSSNCQKD